MVVAKSKRILGVGKGEISMLKIAVCACILSMAVATGPARAADKGTGQNAQSDNTVTTPSGNHNFTTDTGQRRDRNADVQRAKSRNSHR